VDWGEWTGHANNLEKVEGRKQNGGRENKTNRNDHVARRDALQRFDQPDLAKTIQRSGETGMDLLDRVGGEEGGGAGRKLGKGKVTEGGEDVCAVDGGGRRQQYCGVEGELQNKGERRGSSVQSVAPSKRRPATGFRMILRTAAPMARPAMDERAVT